ncbi:hypothetical protein [Comamonas thiooxydans]|uniref:hypothetical protein n=1 Tax=Comamonas thiooxydans TaxID=363952 RepID=UPI002115315C|nr:hypothetical protein [Comamonas thiooxydans]UUE94483.1 hypothetical protein MJ608_02035 [Comamonas thiooxydans]
MNKKVDVVNVLSTPYEAWSMRSTSPQEALELVKNKGLSLIDAFQVKDELVERVSTHVEAASRILREGVDRGLEHHIDDALAASDEYRHLRSLMPQNAPEALNAYQGEFPHYDCEEVDKAINNHGVEAAEGQVLFHGGLWSSDSPEVTTSRPFSTSFCPQVALRNAEWRGKAYDAGRIDLMVLRVKNSQTKAFAYSLEGDHGNEKEVVFASGAKLTLVRETHIADVSVHKVDQNLRESQKSVPAYVVEVEIS